MEHVGYVSARSAQWTEELAIHVAVVCKPLGEDLSAIGLYWACACPKLWGGLVRAAPTGCGTVEPRNPSHGRSGAVPRARRLERRWEGAAWQSPGSERSRSASGNNGSAGLATGDGTTRRHRGRPNRGHASIAQSGATGWQTGHAGCWFAASRGSQHDCCDHGGDYLGPIKGNEAELKDAVDAWIEGQIFPQETLRPADLIQDNKGHGRIERREVWFVNAVELAPYLRKNGGSSTCAWWARCAVPAAARTTPSGAVRK